MWWHFEKLGHIEIITTNLQIYDEQLNINDTHEPHKKLKNQKNNNIFKKIENPKTNKYFKE
jgi:hypothetical protein